MQISLTQQQNILMIPQEFAFLQSSLLANNLIYEINYKINPFKAYREKSNIVKISIYKDSPDQIAKPVFATSAVASDPETMLEEILKNRTRQKEAIALNASFEIVTILSDFTSKIPNDKAFMIRNSDGTNEEIFPEYSFINLASDQPTESVSSVPVYEQSILPTNLEAQRLGGDQIKDIAHDLIFNQSIDPAELVEWQNSIVAARTMQAGLIQKSNTSIYSRDNQTKNFIDSITNDSKQVTDANLEFGSIIQQPEIILTDFLMVSEIVEIPISIIGMDNFIVVFEVINDDGITIQTISRNVENSANISILAIPIDAPSIRVLPVSAKGINYLELQQNDKNGTKIFLFRKKMPISGIKLDSEYQFVSSHNANSNGSAIQVADFSPSTYPIIYRAITVGANGALSSDFSSTIIKGKFDIPGGKLRKLKNFLSLTHEIKEKGIEIFVGGISPNMLSFTLRKIQIGPNGTEVIVDKPIFIDGRKIFSITDSSVVSDKTYKYTGTVTYLDGNEEKISTELLVQYRPVLKSIVSVTSTSPQVKQSGDKLDVQFSISVSFFESEEEQTRRRLQDSGVLSLFQNSLTLSRLQELVANYVTRTNLTTGEVENLGLLSGNEFSDAVLSSVSNASALKDGYEYKYAITSFLRDPRTLLESYTETVVDTINSARSYSYKPSKWLHPETINNGTLVSKQSLLSNHAMSQFTFGTIASIINIKVSLANIYPTLSGAKAVKVNKKINKITWKAHGNKMKIDHFIIKINILGMSSVQGKCHNISDTGQYQFLDELTDNESGAMYYEIIPVLYDYSRGTSIRTNRVII